MKLEIYKITNKQNGKIYIGITNQGANTNRWYKHCFDANVGSIFPLHNAIRKYGKNNFTIEIIETVDDVEVLKEREIYWIKELDSYNRDKGYNLTLGGDGTFGRFHSEETKDKIRQKAYNRVVSKESRQKMSNSHKLRKYNHNEMSNRAKNGNKIRWSNLENKQNASINNKNNKIVLQFDKQMNFIAEYRSVAEAGRSMKTYPQNISRCARGITLSAYGFIWKYKT